MKPTECRDCEILFNADSRLQLKVVYVALEEGSAAAHDYVNEWFAEEHAEHECICPPRSLLGEVNDECPQHG